MKYFQTCLVWMTTYSLIGAPVLLEGCGTSSKEAPAIAQQDPAAAPAQAAATPTQSPQGDPQQAQQANAQAAPIALPDVDLTPAGLDELLAPIALYPDPVLAVMLQASVDPQQVMDGGNWLALDQNNNLKEAALDEASKKAGFTPVMQALLHYPTVIDLMCTQFDWTKQLGAAYQANPKVVLDSVQRLRATAVDNGALKSSSQMKVDVTQQNGQQVVQLEPTNPKVVYVPQYDPQKVYSTTTTTTNADGSSTTTTTTSGPAPITSTNTTTVVEKQSGVSTGSAVLIGLLSFGAGIAVGAAINNNNYYYPSWGYGGVYYGGRPYYPPPYHPYYGGGWGPSYGYNRPVHYGNTNVNVNVNNNYYNRFNNNNNLKANYKPMPVHYSSKPNGVYQNSMGNRPGANQGVSYNNRNPNYRQPQTRPAAGGNTAVQRPAGNTGNIGAQRPGGNTGVAPTQRSAGNIGTSPAQRPTGNAGNNANNWKGQSAYQGNKANFGNKPVDRGYGQANSSRPSGGGGSPAGRPTTGTVPTNRPSTGNASASRPMTQPASRPSTQPASRPQPQQSKQGGAFGGASSGSSSHAASNRGRASMGAPQHSSGGQQAAPRKR